VKNGKRAGGIADTVGGEHPVHTLGSHTALPYFNWPSSNPAARKMFFAL
jgi:hypothetical protein